MSQLPAAGEVKLPRVTKGRRPTFFDDPAIDQMMTFMLEMITEVAVVHDRLDTVERLLDRDGSVTRDDIEGYVAEGEVAAERFAWREGYVKRVLRMHKPQI